MCQMCYFRYWDIVKKKREEKKSILGGLSVPETRDSGFYSVVGEGISDKGKI